MRKLLLSLVGMALPTLLLLAVAEGTLRLLPTSSAMKAQPVNAEAPVFRFAPDRDVVASIDWNFSAVNRRHINNDGFLNDQDYAPGGLRPLLAVIGDSYVEATLVPYRDTLYGRLAESLEGRGRVYSFAASGAPLSQYLVWARYARERYDADALVLVVVGNDFDESLADHRVTSGFHHFTASADGALVLRRFDHEAGAWRDLLRRSALARYLFYNLEAPDAVARLRAALYGGAEPYVGNTRAEASTERLARSKEVVDAFFRELPAHAGLAAERILFLLDGIRPELYAAATLEAAQASYFAEMRRYFLEQARRRGHEAVDLQPLFIARHSAEGLRFEFPTDAHWNAAGHQVAAEAVRASELVRRLFGPQLAGSPDREPR